MPWYIIYFVIAIAAAVVAVWNLAQRRSAMLSIACLLWFLVVLFTWIATEVGIIVAPFAGTTVGNLLLYGLVPIFLILAFFSRRSRQ